LRLWATLWQPVISCSFFFSFFVFHRCRVVHSRFQKRCLSAHVCPYLWYILYALLIVISPSFLLIG
jgi:hypothetical protein